jgi:uncharacterized protein YhhL (DUF1145 family)
MAPISGVIVALVAILCIIIVVITRCPPVVNVVENFGAEKQARLSVQFGIVLLFHTITSLVLVWTRTLPKIFQI